MYLCVKYKMCMEYIGLLYYVIAFLFLVCSSRTIVIFLHLVFYASFIIIILQNINRYNLMRIIFFTNFKFMLVNKPLILGRKLLTER